MQFLNIEEDLFSQCINDFNIMSQIKKMDTTSTYEIDQTNYICRGCNLAMLRGKMPKMCVNNGLIVDVLPDQSLQLSELENNLIALNIVFQKIHLKPKSRWSGTHDRLVNVPIGEQDIINTVQRLPRSPAEACIIPVSLKRKLEYKTTHLTQMIDANKIFKYLKYLCDMGHPSYKFYDDWNIYEKRCRAEDPMGAMLVFPDTEAEIVDLDVYRRELDEIRTDIPTSENKDCELTDKNIGGDNIESEK